MGGKDLLLVNNRMLLLVTILAVGLVISPHTVNRKDGIIEVQGRFAPADAAEQDDEDTDNKRPLIKMKTLL